MIALRTADAIKTLREPYLGGSGYNGSTSIPIPEGCEAQPDATSVRA
jgi:hypothetical protein